jgi:hypothetical protein
LIGVPSDQLDAAGCGGPDVYLDLNSAPFPFPDNCCNEVRARHFLEHSVVDHIFAALLNLARTAA